MGKAVETAQGLRLLAREGLRAGFIFLDPPYAETAEYERALGLLASLPLADEQTMAIVDFLASYAATGCMVAWNGSRKRKSLGEVEMTILRGKVV